VLDGTENAVTGALFRSDVVVAVVVLKEDNESGVGPSFFNRVGFVISAVQGVLVF